MVHSLVQSNIGQLVGAYRTRIQALDATMREATGKATLDFWKEGRKRMNEGIYAKPVPTHAESKATGGRKKARKNAPLWVRTGNLRGSEKWHRPVLMMGGWTGTIENTASYAAARHVMPDGKLKFRHGDRTCHWRTDTIDDWNRQGKLRRYYHEGLSGLLMRTRAR